MLTVLGIIIGVSAVIIMSAIGQGSQKMIEKEINDLGTNLLIVSPGSSNTGGVKGGAGSFNRLTINDVDKIRKQSKWIKSVTPIVQSGGQIIANGKNWNSQIIGVSSDYFVVRSWELKYGIYFSEKDIKMCRKVALLGTTVATKLFSDENPIGKTIRIRTIPFKVIGVLNKKGQAGMGHDQDDIIITPWTTVLYRLKGGMYIDMINASAINSQSLEQAKNELSVILRSSHRLSAEEQDDFTIQNQTEITQMVTKTSKIMTWLLGSIAAISLLVGGIGIMNIMLVSVTERTHEIGIRLSVGARAIDILVQFLLEAVLLSICGGIIGIFLAICVSVGLNSFTSLYTVVRFEIVILAFLFSGVVGIFFGYYPAKQAAHCKPIESLRYE